MAEGAGRNNKIKESKKRLQQEVGKVGRYKELQKNEKLNPGLGQFINADHWPPVSCLLEARKLNQNSILATAFLKVGTNSSPLDPNLIPDVHKYHGRELPAVYVPKEVHLEFPSTKSKQFRTCLATYISMDDVVGAFKVMTLGSMPRSNLNSNKNFKDFQDNQKSKTRLDVYGKSFEKVSLKMVNTYFNLLRGVMTEDHCTTLTSWIKNNGYNNPNDPHRKLVSNLQL